MKKKVLAVILAIVSVAALAACGSNGAAEPKADGSAATEKTVVQVQIPRLKSEQKVFQRVKSWVSYMHLPWKMPDIKWNVNLKYPTT